MLFEWDDAKNASNSQKHNLTFEEAIQVFEDPFAIELFDQDHSSDVEDRFKVIGLLHESQVILISLIYTERDEIVRVISARRATNEERSIYEQKR